MPLYRVVLQRRSIERSWRHVRAENRDAALDEALENPGEWFFVDGARVELFDMKEIENGDLHAPESSV